MTELRTTTPGPSPTRPNPFPNRNWNDLWNQAMAESSGWDCCGYHWDRLSEARRFDREMQEEEKRIVEADVAGLNISPQDRILEIGAGTGAYTIPLARRAFMVTAVEPGLGMRQVLQENAAAAGLANIGLVAGKWEDVNQNTDLQPPYDLVLAAFSLGMTDIRAAVAKMTAVSRQTVCLFWFIGDNTCDQRCRELWPPLYGRPFAPEPKADLLLNVLFDLEIHPHVQVFPFRRQTVFRSLDQAVNLYRSRFNLEPRKDADEVLRRHLDGILVKNRDGLVRDCRARCVKIWWSVTSQ